MLSHRPSTLGLPLREPTVHVGRALARIPRWYGPIVPRRRLAAVLDELAPVLLLQAPEGFGRTTLVALWAERMLDDGCAVVWVSAQDVPASDLPGHVAREVEATLGADRPVADASLSTSLRTTTDRLGQLVVVIDDLPGSTWLATASQLMAVAETNRDVHLVVITDQRSEGAGGGAARDAPRTAARVLDAADLLFRPGEIDVLGTKLGIVLPPGGVDKIVAATLGRPGDVVRVLRHLAVAPLWNGELSLEDVGDAVSNVHLALHEEASPEVTRFLLDTSLAASLSPQLLSELTAVSDPEAIAHDLLAMGILREERSVRGTVWRYEPGFRRALLEQSRQHDPEGYLRRQLELAELRTGTDLGAALGHAVDSGDDEWLSRFVRCFWAELITFHGDALAEAWHDLARAGRHLDDAPLVHAFLAFATGPAVRDVSGEEAPTTLGSLLRLVSARRSRPLAPAVGVATEILAVWDGAASRSRSSGSSAGRLVVLLEVALVWLHAGDLRRASETLTHVHAEARQKMLAPLARTAADGLALVAMLRGDVVSAQAWLQDSPSSVAVPSWFARTWGGARSMSRALLELESGGSRSATAEPAPHPEDELWYLAVHANAQAALLAGSPECAIDQVWSALQARAAIDPAGLAHALLHGDLVRASLAAGQGNRARATLDALPIGAARSVLEAQVELRAARPHAVAPVTAAVVWAHDVDERQRMEALLLEAEALTVTGNAERALPPFGRALDIARRGGVLRPFASVDVGVLERLVVLAGGDAHVLAGPFLVRGETLPAAAPVFVELPERQLLVLQRLAEGLSMPEIATELFVSRNTIKTQVKEIYRRLGVHTRPEAMALAHELGLLTLGAPKPPDVRAAGVGHALRPTGRSELVAP